MEPGAGLDSSSHSLSLLQEAALHAKGGETGS